MQKQFNDGVLAESSQGVRGLVCVFVWVFLLGFTNDPLSWSHYMM